MQLDGYSADLRLAFEYQGEQHFEQTWYQGADQLAVRMTDDEEKAKLCRINGLDLVVVPPFGPLHKTSAEGLLRHVVDAIEASGKVQSVPDLSSVVDRFHSYKRSHLKEIADQLAERKIILEGPRLYAGLNSKGTFRCGECDWVWSTSLSSVILQNTGCGNCSGGVRKDIRFLHALADAKGFECLSKIYTNNRTPYEWRCKNCHHTWSASPANFADRYVKGRLVRGSACKVCGQNGETLDVKRNWHKYRL